MPSQNQYDTIIQQCNSFRELGHKISFNIQDQTKDAAPKITLMLIDTLKDIPVKSYKFCDPDWDVVIAQLSTLYKRIKQHAKN